VASIKISPVSNWFFNTSVGALSLIKGWRTSTSPFNAAAFFYSSGNIAVASTFVLHGNQDI